MWQRNMDWLPLIGAPNGDPTHNRGRCPDQELNPQTFGVQDNAPTKWATCQHTQVRLQREHGPHPTHPLLLSHMLPMMEAQLLGCELPSAEAHVAKGQWRLPFKSQRRTGAFSPKTHKEPNPANSHMSKLGGGSSLDETCYGLNVWISPKSHIMKPHPPMWWH